MWIQCHMSGIDTDDRHVYVLSGNFCTDLFFFRKGPVLTMKKKKNKSMTSFFSLRGPVGREQWLSW